VTVEEPSGRAEPRCRAAGCRAPGTELVSRDIWLCRTHAEVLLADLEYHAGLES